MLRTLVAISTSLTLSYLVTSPALSQVRDSNKPGDFDFYVLALSWSPSYCSLEGPRANRQQCGSNRQFGFVVHGLWPQNEYGYPANCTLNDRRDRASYVPREKLSSLSDIMPSIGLAAYQWRKHGSCSGLTQSNYFSTLRAARSQISIPPSLRSLSSGQRVDPTLIEKAFIAANPGMAPNGIAVTCKRNHLQEVRICLSKDLQFRSCEQVDQSACRSHSVLMPASR